MVLSDRLEEWANEYRAEGMQQGEALALRKLLTKRFGAIPNDVLSKISQVFREQIETWFDCVMGATSFVEVFGPLTH